MKIYKLVKERFQDDFEKKISVLLSEGYKLHGSPSIVTFATSSADFMYLQALIKEEKEKCTTETKATYTEADLYQCVAFCDKGNNQSIMWKVPVWIEENKK